VAIGLSLLSGCNCNVPTVKSNSNVLTWTKGLNGGGACGRTVEAIYTNASKGPIDQASEQVNALRAEKLMDKAR
jgi:hypothetical protein